MSTSIVEAASVALSLRTTQLDEGAILVRDELRALLLPSIAALSGAVRAVSGKP